MPGIEYQWNQYGGSVVITYPIRALKASNVEVEFAPLSCSITIVPSAGADVYLDFDPLFDEIDPGSSSYEVLLDRLSVTLVKKNPMSCWTSLVVGGPEERSDMEGVEWDHTPMADSVPIQILSDLHLEFEFKNPNGPGSVLGYNVFDFPRAAPNLVLLGDIGLAIHHGLFLFLERQIRRFDRVFYVMGNHEGYGSDYETARAQFRKFEASVRTRRSAAPAALGEFVFLDRTRYDLSPTLTLLGCTLWSAVPPAAAKAVARGVADFTRVRGWSVDAHNAAHARDAAWLAAAAARVRREAPARRVAVLSHHAPVRGRTSSPAHRGGALDSAFATDMQGAACWGAGGVRLWAFGHTHWNVDFVERGVRVVCNQRGYQGEEVCESGFDAAKVLHV